jgi:hypothetical protein
MAEVRSLMSRLTTSRGRIEEELAKPLILPFRLVVISYWLSG